MSLYRIQRRILFIIEKNILQYPPPVTGEHLLKYKLIEARRNTNEK